MADVTEPEEVDVGMEAVGDESPLAAKNNAAGGGGIAAAIDAAGKAFGSPQPDPAKQLDFGMAAAPTPATPVVTSAPTDSDEVDYNTFITETLLWTNKVRSAFYFVVGLLLWVVARSVITSNTTLVTGVCYALLATLAFNFLRGIMMPEFQKRCTWSHSAWTRAVISAFTVAVSAEAALVDSHLNGLDPLHTLEVGLGLWALSLAGRSVDAVTLLLALHLAAFTLPAAYKLQKAKVDAVVADVYGKAKAKYDSVDRKVKASAILGLLGLLLFLLPTADRFAALFVFLAYGRAILKPAELAHIQKRIEPVSATVQRLGNTATTMAVSTLNKYELTPTPSKKKNL